MTAAPIAKGKARLLCQQAVGRTILMDPSMYRGLLTAMAQDACAKNTRLTPTSVELAAPSVAVDTEEREVANLIDAIF